ncbi:MAG: hypothetical protein GX334_04090 [Firmicutes bacterium]|nr:hypothetical protein [Bacillota bacterium]
MFCPVCRSINTGKVGSNVYYCADCLLEFTDKNGQMEIFYIDAEGASFALRDKNIALKLVETIRSGSQLFPEKIEELIKG